MAHAQTVVATVEPSTDELATFFLPVRVPSVDDLDAVMAAVEVAITVFLYESNEILTTPVFLKGASGLVFQDATGEPIAQFEVDLTPRTDSIPHRETTYLVRIHGLSAEPIEVTVPAEGPEVDHIGVVHTVIAETVAEAIEDEDVAAIAPTDDETVGVVIPAQRAHLPVHAAVGHAVATYTVIDLGFERIEEFLKEQL